MSLRPASAANPSPWRSAGACWKAEKRPGTETLRTGTKAAVTHSRAAPGGLILDDGGRIEHAIGLLERRDIDSISGRGGWRAQLRAVHDTAA